MATDVIFARLAARPVDRAHIAASIVPTRDELFALEGFDVSPGNAALISSFMSRDSMSWADIRIPLRYQPEHKIRTRLDECVKTGVITFDGGKAAYTPAGSDAAQGVFDAHASTLEAKWANTARQVQELLDLITPVAAAAVSAGRASSHLVDQTLTASHPTMASDLWRALAKVRRFRADCHAQAWQAAGHTTKTIVALASDDPDRVLVEQHTDELNAEIWSRLVEGDQLRFMSCLAALDGSGTPT